MPSNWLYIDTQFPTFTGNESLPEKVSTIQNYMFMLVEQLRYTLHNLDLTNMNGKAMEDFVSNITDPIYAQIKDSDGNMAQLQLDVQGLKTQVQDAEGNISALQQTSTSLASQLQDAQGNISSLQQTTSGLSSTVVSQGGQISSLQQTVNGFSLSVMNGSNFSTIQLTSNGAVISSQTISMTGMVTFTDLSTPGATIIDGGNLKTDTVTASKLEGEVINLLGSPGWSAGTMNLAPSSTSGFAVELNSVAGMRLQAGSGNLYLKGGSDAFVTIGTAIYCYPAIAPTEDGYSTCGTAARRWSDVYCQNAEIQTSDESGKKDIEPLDPKYITMMENLTPITYRLIDGQSGRRHVGFSAQQVEQAMISAGIDSVDFGGFVKDKNEAGEDVYMLRYGEFMGIMWSKIMQLDSKLKELAA